MTTRSHLLGDRLEHWAAEQPDTIAITYRDASADHHTLTYRDLAARVARLGGALLGSHVGPGDTVAFLDKNHPACLEVSYAAARIGAAAVVLNWRLSDDELIYALNDCGAGVLVVGAGFSERIEAARASLPKLRQVIVLGGIDDSYEQWLDAGAPVDRRSAVDPEAVCTILYSSGTTGRPKGVMLTHHNWLAQVANATSDMGYVPGDMPLIAMPLFHVGGMSFAVLTLHYGCTGYLTRDADLSAMVDGLTHGATHAFLVPAVLATVLGGGAPSIALFGQLKYMLYGAAPMPRLLLQTAMDTWPATRFVQYYGLTEVCGGVARLTPEAHRDTSRPDRLASAGTIVPGVEARLVDPTTLAPVEPGSAGELWLRSEQLSPGYHGKPEATAEAITPDGWFRTGDVARFDDGGFLFIEDRIKDMIITGGENVYSPEVERVLATYPGVREVAVIGVPDQRWGETVKAVIAFEPGHTATQADIIAHSRAHLAGYKCPTSVDIVDALPRNPTGKIMKRDLRLPYVQGEARHS